jgi:uncharacterized membrane protein YeaQ/YmgE (transglycosylase-associated protein family)
MIVTVLTLLLIGAVIGFGMHFLVPYKFSRLLVDIVAGTVGSAIGAIISSPFAPPNAVGQKIVFLIASIIGALLAVLTSRALKI